MIVLAGLLAVVMLPGDASAGDSQSVNGENMGGTVPVFDAGAVGGRAGSVVGTASFGATVPQGHYLLTAAIRGSGRIRFRVEGERVAEYEVSASYGSRSAVVFVPGAGAQVSLEELGGHVVVDWAALEPSHPQFTTAGDQVRGPDGRPVVPRGVNSGLTGIVPDPGPDHGPEDFDGMAAWNANVVRIHVNQQFWLDLGLGSCRYAPGYQALIDEEVRRVTSRGMVALVDLHYASGGQRCATDADGLYKMADQHSLTFWRDAADRYRGNPLVWFDLFNEPHDISDAVWRDGSRALDRSSTLTYSTLTYQAVGMQDLYEAVRSTGATNVVVVSGNGWAADPRPMVTRPLDGYGLVAGVHIYGTDPEGRYRRPSDFTDEHASSVGTLTAPLSDQFPILVSEFGTPYWETGAFNQKLVSWLEARGYGWIGYQWAVKTWSEGSDLYGILAQGDAGASPNAAGLVIRDTMLAQNRAFPAFEPSPTAATPARAPGLLCQLLCPE